MNTTHTRAALGPFELFSVVPICTHNYETHCRCIQCLQLKITLYRQHGLTAAHHRVVVQAHHVHRLARPVHAEPCNIG